MSARLTHACWCGGREPPLLRSEQGVTAGKALLFLILFVLAFFASPGHQSPLRLMGSATAADAAAGAPPWLAEQVRGTVRIRATGQAAAWQPLAGETMIAPDSEVATGKDGVAVLANGVDRIRLSPNSHVVLPAPAEEDAGLLTLIRQKLGRVFFDVGPRPDRRFEVDAPYLVVLVKGTKFTVRTNYIANSVDVDEGTVEVRAADDGDGPGTLVTAGETANTFAGSDAIDVAPSENDTDSDPTSQGKGGAEPRPQAPPPTRAPAPPEDPEGEGGGDGGNGGGAGGGGAGGSGGGSGGSGGSGGAGGSGGSGGSGGAGGSGGSGGSGGGGGDSP